MATLPQLRMKVNEVFGPTLQGEGARVGYPCVFLRLHGCPVKCPGCDTHYTWDGSEQVSNDTMQLQLSKAMRLLHGPNRGCDLIVSGGEPLLYYANEVLLEFLQDASTLAYTTLETSGYMVEPPDAGQAGHLALLRFLRKFKHIGWCPKVTPCLTSPHLSKAQLLATANVFLNELAPKDTSIKLVVRDQADMDAVLAFDREYSVRARGFQLYLMPYGMTREEVAAGARNLVPFAAKHGYPVTPRLHALLWDTKRDA